MRSGYVFGVLTQLEKLDKDYIGTILGDRNMSSEVRIGKLMMNG